MASWSPARQLQRDDRYVQRCRVRGGGQQSPTRLQFCVEEALRLISLPGENDGRNYYFRRVIVRGVSPRARLQEWIEAIQAALLELCSHAVHGSDSRAGTGDAVFFHSYHEALEILLAKTFRGDLLDSWFWPEVSGVVGQVNRAEKVLAIIQRLSELPASWLAVADSVLAAIASGDPVALLTVLPPSTVQGWLQEIAPRHIPSGYARPVPLQQSVAGILLRSAHALGSADLRVVWLAALAAIQVVPSDLSTGAAVSRAQATLQSLVAREALRMDSAIHDSARIPSPDAGADTNAVEHLPPLLETIRFDGHPLPTRLRFTDTEKEPMAEETSPASTFGPTRTKAQASPETAMTESLAPAVGGESERQHRADTLSGSLVLQSVSAEEPTRAAGLYFLLNALSRLNIAEALARNPFAAEQGLVAHVMERLAWHAGVQTRDSAWGWINSALSQIPPSDAAMRGGVEVFPANLRLAPGKLLDLQDLSRIWSVAVRRWCWHAGGITVHEVVNRRGRVSMNRTDLDVTLPLSSAELRIRRVGLDIDPGWLPWFGKVVRFHYVWDEAANVQ